MTEEWRRVRVSPNYMVSSLGRVVGDRHKVELKSRLSDSGYQRVRLYTENGPRSFNVNWLVCDAFQGPQPTKAHQAAHNDNVRTNNTADNLRWATPKENQEDRRRHGTRMFDDRHPNVKVPRSAIDEIKATIRNSRSGSRTRPGVRVFLAQKFGVHPETISLIAKGARRTVVE